MFKFINKKQFIARHRSGKEIKVTVSPNTGDFISRKAVITDVIPFVKLDLRHSAVIIGFDDEKQESVLCELSIHQNQGTPESFYSIVYMSDFVEVSSNTNPEDLNITVYKGVLDNTEASNVENYLLLMEKYIKKKRGKPRFFNNCYHFAYLFSFNIEIDYFIYNILFMNFAFIVFLIVVTTLFCTYK